MKKIAAFFLFYILFFPFCKPSYAQIDYYRNDSTKMYKLIGKDTIEIDLPSPFPKERYNIISQMPSPKFKGNLDSFIKNNLEYPSIARRKKIEGTVVVYCIIDTTGKIIFSKVISNKNQSLNTEALRIVTLTNLKWETSKINGKLITQEYKISIPFKL